MLYSITTLIIALTLTNNPFIVSIVIACRYIPFVIFSFIAGSFAETGNLRRIIVTSLVTRFTLVSLVALFLHIGKLNILVLAFLTFLISTARVFGDSAISMSYIRHAEKSRWTKIGTKVDLSRNILEATLTAAAGTIFLGAGSTNSVTIVSFLLAAALVAMLPTLTHFPHDPKGTERTKIPNHSFKDAWQTFSDNHVLLRMCFSVMLQNSALICVQSMLLIYIIGTGTSESWATLITGSFAIGLIIGASISAKILARFGVGTILTLSISVATFSIACIYTAVNYNSTIACVVTCLYGTSVSVGNIAQRRYRQEIVPMETLGRVSSLFGIAIMGSMPIASIMAGVIADTSGYASLFMFASALSLASLLLIHTERRRINRVGTLG